MSPLNNVNLINIWVFLLIKTYLGNLTLPTPARKSLKLVEPSIKPDILLVLRQFRFVSVQFSVWYEGANGANYKVNIF